MSTATDNPLWWIDFIEDDLPPKEKDELRTLLKHSSTDRLIVKNLMKLREIVQDNDPVFLPESASYYDDLHEKIMNQVNALEIERVETRTATIED